MCGRYTLFETEKLADRYNAKRQFDFENSYNIAPGEKVPVNYWNPDNNKPEIKLMQWGLIPHWSKDSSIGQKMINARAETINEKLAFKKPFATMRCLVPSNGFYEWKREEGSKTPYFIRPETQTIISFAGIYDIWSNPETGEEIYTFAIITRPANENLTKIHDRMPVIISENNEKKWLDPNQNSEELQKLLLHESTSNLLQVTEVSRSVNKPQNNSIDLIQTI
jgi:putative SOS response-associated peptidase YedK